MKIELGPDDFMQIGHCLHRELTRIAGADHARNFMTRPEDPTTSDFERIDHLEVLLDTFWRKP